MRVNVDGGKYTICSDDATGRLWVERGDCKDWMVNPAGGKMLISVAYELACLRQIVSGVVNMLQYADSGAVTEAGLLRHIGGIGDAMRYLDGYTDYRRNLNDPLNL